MSAGSHTRRRAAGIPPLMRRVFARAAASFFPDRGCLPGFFFLRRFRDVFAAAPEDGGGAPGERIMGLDGIVLLEYENDRPACVASSGSEHNAECRH